MKTLLVFLTFLALTFAGPDLPNMVYKKIANYHLNANCWGKRNTLMYYKMVKEAQEKCMRLRPTFDIDFDDHHYTPYKPQNQGFFGTRSSGHPSGFSASSPQGSFNAYDAWMAFMAFQQQQQQQQQGSAYSKNYSPNRYSNRYKRSAHSAEEIAEFKYQLAEFKMEKKDNIGNLTCVLADMGVLDGNLDVNMRFYTHDAWNNLQEPIDPEFRAKIIEKYQDCHDIAQSIPQDILDKHPMARRFGRHMIFFKCSMKAERAMCAKQEILRWMEDMHDEPVTPQMLRQLGLPEDKYDAAILAMKVMHNAVKGPKKFVMKALFGDGDMD